MPAVRTCLLLFGLALAGCSAPDPETLRFGLATAPTTLDPRFAADAVSVRLSRLLDCRLVEFDAASRPAPGIATWRVEAPHRYRVRLRDDIRFHDGRPVTATDVVATYRAVMDPQTASPHRLSLENVAAIHAIDRHTVEFRLSRPDAIFPGSLVIGILPADAIGGPVATARAARPPGCGPFELERRGADGTILMRRRSDGRRIEFSVVRNALVRGWKLLGGELDVIQGDVSPDTASWLGGDDRAQARSVAGNTFSYLGFNLRAGPTADPRVRRAVAHAIDRRAIVEHLFGGRARLAEAIFPPEHWAGAAGLERLQYDPDRARALLADAGVRLPLALEFKTSTDPFRVRVATAIQSQLAQVGIALSVRSLEWGTFFGDIRAGRFELYSLSWVGLRQPDIFRYAFHSASLPPEGANRGAYRAPEVDRLIERAEREQGEEHRRAAYRAIQRRLLDDLPYVPLWFEDHIFVTRHDIRGYTTNADGHFDALQTIE